MSVEGAISRSSRASARRSGRRVARTRTVRESNVPRVVSLVARLACLFVAASASGSSAGVARWTMDDDNFASLSSWLVRFKFDVPAQSFRVPYAGIDVDLSAITCDDATVGSMSSDTTATGSKGGGNAIEDELRASVSDVRFECVLAWGVTDRLGNRAIGDATATVSKASARASFTLDVDDEMRPPLPREIRVKECEAQVSVTELTFTGGKFATVLNAASPAIRLELGRTLGALTCSSMTSGLKKFSGTDTDQQWEEGQLARLERVMQSAFEEARPVPFPSYNSTAGVANLSSSPLVAWCEYMVGAYIGAQGPRSVSAFARWIENQNEQNDEYNARVVRVPPVWLFDSATRLPKVSLSLPESALREVASTIEGASFVVYDMKVLGLETAKTLKGPTVRRSGMAGNVSGVDTQLDFTIGWERVLFNVSGILDILPTNVQLDPWIESLVVSFESRDPTFVVTVGLAIDESELEELRGTRQTNLACVARTIENARVVQVRWSGNPGSIIVNPWRPDRAANASDDRLEASLDKLITETSLLLTENLDEAVRLAISYQVGSNVRDWLDEELQRHLVRVRSGACPRSTTATRTASGLVRLLSVVFLYAAAISFGMFVTVLFGYFTVVVALGKFGRRCYDVALGHLTMIHQQRDDARRANHAGRGLFGDEDDEDDEDYDPEEDALAYSTPRSSSTKRNYTRASFHSGRRRSLQTEEDDTSMITESLLGEAEIDDDGNIDIDEESLVRRSVALCDSDVIPKSVKFGMPVLYAMTCMLFLSSNLSVGAAVQVRLFKRELAPSDAGDVDILLPEVFTFSLLDTVSNMWRAGVYALSALILIFSGIWPYVKIVAMWSAWSTSWVNPDDRRRLLERVDAAGKWSLIDVFVMMLFMVLFHFQVATSSGGLGALTVSVRPRVGFFIFVLATFVSMILGHVTRAYGDTDRENQRRGDEDERDETLDGRNEDESADDGESDRAVVLWKAAWSEDSTRAWIVGCGTCAVLAGTMASLIFAFNAICIQFTMLGIAGAALGPEASTRSMSLRSVIFEVRHASPDLSAFLSRLNEWILLTLSFLAPLLRLCAMVALWTLPLRRTQRGILWRVKGILDAWSALDVMLFSFLAAIFQIRRFLAFMLGGNCDALNKTLQQFVTGPLQRGHDLCFDVHSSLGTGCWLLATCTLGASLASFVVEKARRLENGVAKRTPSLLT